MQGQLRLFKKKWSVILKKNPQQAQQSKGSIRELCFILPTSVGSPMLIERSQMGNAAFDPRVNHSQLESETWRDWVTEDPTGAPQMLLEAFTPDEPEPLGRDRLGSAAMIGGPARHTPAHTMRVGCVGSSPESSDDAVRNALPGAGTYDWVRAVRQPTYRMVQRRS